MPPSKVSLIVSARLIIALVLLLTSLPTFPSEQQTDEAFQQGWVLYQQNQVESALPYMREAAKEGHVEAAYYAGEILRQSRIFMTDEAFKWYRQAAEGGDVDAMLRLGEVDFCEFTSECEQSDRSWVDVALETTLPLAENGSPDAMDKLFSIYQIKDETRSAYSWLEKAASTGHGEAGWLLGHRIKEGHGFYWTKSGRREDAMKWLKKSAENGYPPAMVDVAHALREQNDLKEARKWIEKAGKTDYFEGVGWYGRALLEGSEGDFGFENARRKKGYAILTALYREISREYVISIRDRHEHFLSEEEITEAEAMADQMFRNTDIILYQPKFGL